jgi:hypothetical protein
MRVHLLDEGKKNGIRCDNPQAMGPATKDAGNVTCIDCSAKPRRTRNPGRPERKIPVPPGPAGGD